MNFKIFLTLGLLLCPKMAQAAVNVFACEPEWGALAREIGGDGVKVTIATSGTEDPHHVRAKPSLLAAMRKADLVFCTGAGLEAGWLPVLMQQAAGASVQPGQPGYLVATDFIALLDKPQNIDRAMGDIHPEGNPHIQADPQNFPIIARALAERLAVINPAQADIYKAELAEFDSRWQSSLGKWSADAASLRGVPVVVYHDGWAYMLRWLGMKKIASLEAKPGVPPTPTHLQIVLAAARSSGVKLILLTPFDNDDAAKWLSGQTGAQIVRLPFTVGGTGEADTLEALFGQTISLLKGARP